MPIKMIPNTADVSQFTARLTQDEANISALQQTISSGVIPKGDYNTYADMLSALPNPSNGWIVIIKDDETKQNAQNTMYMYYNGEWYYMGSVDTVNDASTSVKGILKLDGDLTGTADTPQLTNVLSNAGIYNIANNSLTFDNKGRCIAINVSTSYEWTFISKANERTLVTNTFTVPNYDIQNSQIWFIWNGNFLIENEYWTRINSTTINTLFDVQISDDVEIINIKNFGSLNISNIMNDNAISTSTTYSSSKINNTYVNINNNIIPLIDNVNNIGSGSYRYNTAYFGTSPIVGSDKRIKRNIEECDLGLNFINSIKPKKYQLIDGKRMHYGLIADQVKEVLNEKDFAGYIKSNDNEEKLQFLRYEEFISPIIKSIQELDKKYIDKHEEKDKVIIELKNRIEYLELSIFQRIKLWFKYKFSKNK
ncbi:tail fiber domain-containing protein [Clostridium sp.]|uniref:tail fiber domain-containing protein n=1 Tax=Clostridium sp. TaxID=1506 RepID=UPI00263A0330|nr:tail fiber domain-containing protein [Clostridium sp.]